MIIGFVGSGSMAAAIARGIAGEADGMLFSDSGSGRAAALAAELGGEAVSSEEVAKRADAIVLAVKPAALDAVAPALQEAGEIVSVLAATPLARLREAFPDALILRAMPNVGVEVRQGVICIAGDALSPGVGAALERIAHVVEIDEKDFDGATAVMGCAPAYLALAVEAIADAGADDGLDPELARELVVETTAGTAELLRLRHPADVRRAVASPGGSTEAGLEELDRLDARGAFYAAVHGSLRRMRQ
ncbi:MAG TPA: pyrroline-5-carboxylate reductase dimerization domain-containing protein [Solirubrobacterales bacterium]|jgi:pyrroline-5-carboxylate reductase|nr:pyrroline-5-carboxylate reductase dimerization domain-containing protein [Solirubrobacterales bacterium]